MRMFVCVFSVYFGLLAIWWSHLRTLRSNQLPGTPPIVKSAEDMSLLEWALGPIEPEREESVCEECKLLSPLSPNGQADPLTAESQESFAKEAHECLAREAPSK